jgi:hypothetical protein
MLQDLVVQLELRNTFPTTPEAEEPWFLVVAVF